MNNCNWCVSLDIAYIVALIDRKQFAKIGDSSSNALGVSCGVPQGSVQGPIFSYINDTCNVSKIFKFGLFADDTHILYSDENVKKLNNVVNSEQTTAVSSLRHKA